VFTLIARRTAALALAAVAGLSLAGAARAQGYYGIDRGTCDRSSLSHTFDTSSNNIVGSALGAAAGGLLGSQFGHGSGKTTMTVVGVLGGALAGGAIGRSMQPVDQACVNQTLEHGQTGQTVAWQNPDDGSTYQVTPTRSYEDNGTNCREYTTTGIIDGQQQQILGRACRQPDGTWKQM
jgi:surface antigen